MIHETTKPRLVIIVGPTAVGKTKLAISLASEAGGEIISADSMQVYRHMDIGTAKPSADERQSVRHHLLDVVNPDENFSAARFVETADEVIQELHKGRKPIFVVGGTGLYIRALWGGLFPGPATDEELRSFYRRQQEIYGPDHLYNELTRIDSLAAERINPHDSIRILRALEVMTLSGRSIVERQEEHGFRKRRYEYIKIGLTLDRPILYERIDGRVRNMMDAGLIDETRRLLALGYDENIRPMQSLGYRYVLAYLHGRMGVDEVIRLTARDTRRYAKRQGTWFRAETDIEWFSAIDSDMIGKSVRNFLAGVNREIA
ncbi:MAG: tRNA (adenosine(37)-N6)-dimethylallyltransferase MiaA [Syntrophales bacterium]|nr:tRNA (adenosine(37)-N6)-dimethylallyltransferase MiaA [Syntrophales bacterium]